MDPNDPRTKEFLARVKYVDPNFEQLKRPQVQTIYGPAVFARSKMIGVCLILMLCAGLGTN